MKSKIVQEYEALRSSVHDLQTELEELESELPGDAIPFMYLIKQARADLNSLLRGAQGQLGFSIENELRAREDDR